MKNSMVLTGLMMLLALVSACDSLKNLTKPAIKEFKSEAGGFTISAPGEMKENSQEIDSPAGKIKINLYQTTSGNTAYMTSYTMFPDAAEQPDPEEMLDSVRDGAITKVGGKIVAETKISLDGNPGREVAFEGKAPTGQEASSKAQFILAKDRLYQNIVIAPKGRLNNAEADEFLKSFKLIK